MSSGRILFGFFLSVAIGWLAYRRGSLAPSGVVGAILTGTATFGFGGWTWGLLLVAFFVSSSLLSHYKRARKADLAEKFAKGERRDLAQTLANGGLGALLALAALLLVDLPGQPRAGNPLYVFLAFSYFGAIATVNADTWSTELGVLAARPPRLITSGKVVAVGTSGAISGQGVLAALAGSAFIGLVAFSLIQVAALATTGRWLLADFVVILIAVMAGLAGSLFDSLLGATVQQIFWCDTCGKETERQVHACGATTRPLRGWRWLNNDAVNFVSSVVGGLLAGGLGLLFLV